MTALAVLLLVPFGIAADWEPVPAADLAATVSASDPKADVEVLFSEQILETETEGSVVVTDAGSVMVFSRGISAVNTVSRNRVRAKVYSAKGVEMRGKFTVDGDVRVSDAEARVVKPDGAVQELKKADIIESEAQKGRAKRVSFVFPDLAPGDVVEYRWRSHSGGNRGFGVFPVQQRFPVREFRISIKGALGQSYVSWVNCPKVEQKREGTGITLTIRDLPAFEPEELMPARFEHCAWLFILPTPLSRDSKDLWPEYSTEWARNFEVATKPTGAMKTLVAQITAGTSDDEERLRRIYEYCQGEIANRRWSDESNEKARREKLREQESLWRSDRAAAVRHVLEDRIGSPEGINHLFAALARAAGFEAHQVRFASREFLTKIRTNVGWPFLTRDAVGVKVGEQIRYLDPSGYWNPYGVLHWADAGAVALRCGNKKEVEFVTLPSAPAEATQVRRQARLALDAEGTLAGEVEEVFTGSFAITFKASHWRRSDEDCAKEFEKLTHRRLPGAELTGITFTNLRSRELPLTVKYRVRVPAFAQQAGSRLVLAPGYFEAGENVLFTETERKFPVAFPFARQEHDDIEIVLPEGYALDNPSAPPPVGDGGKALGATYQVKYVPRTRTLGYRRDFTLGGNGITTFRVESYPLVKRLFEQLHAADAHSLMLKPKETGEPSPAAATAPAQP